MLLQADSEDSDHESSLSAQVISTDASHLQEAYFNFIQSYKAKCR